MQTSHPFIQRPSHTQPHAFHHTGEQSHIARERATQSARHAAEAHQAKMKSHEKVARLRERQREIQEKLDPKGKEKGKETEQEQLERERLEKELREVQTELRQEEGLAAEAETEAGRAEREAEKATLDEKVANDTEMKDLNAVSKNGPSEGQYRELQLVDPNALQVTNTAALDAGMLRSAQSASNRAAGVATSSPPGQYASFNESLGGNPPEALKGRQYDSVTQKIATPPAGTEGTRTTNFRRYLALAGIGTLITSLGSLGYMTYLYLTVKNTAQGEPPPEGLQPDKEEALTARIKAWLKATEKDSEFWENFARLALDASLNPPLTLTDHILFCSYAIDFYPVGSFVFDSEEDVILLEMHLVAAYSQANQDGTAMGKGAAAMYRKVSSLKYSAGGQPEAVLPRQVQALVLRRALMDLAVPSPTVELMALAVELAEDTKLTDTAHWQRFADYRAGTKTRPPLTLRDEMQFCGYATALTEDTGFYFERKETAPDFIAQLVAKFDAQTKSTAGLYALAPTLPVTAGTPLPRRVQAQLLRAALAQLEAKDSGTGLPSLVQKWADKPDADYWAEFVAYKQTAKPPLLLVEEIQFCTHTLNRFPVPADYVMPSPDERQGYVDSLVVQFKTSGSTADVYPLLIRLRDRPPALPRAIQALIMRQALLAISDAMA